MSRTAQWPANPAVVERKLLRHSEWDGLLVVLALLHGAVLIHAPSVLLIGAGLWWNANTIAHNFIHLPFFKNRILNRLFSAYQSLLLGIPQRLWRDRHLTHHAGLSWRWRRSRQLAIESALVGLLWILLLCLAPEFFLRTYLPGCLLGLALCHLQGYYEHARGTTSHYGSIYNLLFFNDGYHVEHHSSPGRHWKTLPATRLTGVSTSRWPACLRWLESAGPAGCFGERRRQMRCHLLNMALNALEKCVALSPFLQRRVLAIHQRAFQKLLPHLPEIRRIGIVGGGLFPRTALILQRLLPRATITIIEANATNIETARKFLGPEVEFRNEFYPATSVKDLDLLVIPLAFIGERRPLYQTNESPPILIHDWIWRRTGRSAVVSWPLLKRLNLAL